MITEKSGNFVVLIGDNLVEGNKCMYLLLKRKSYVQTDATTPNIVGPTTLGVVASVLVVLCKRMQQLPTMLGPALHRGKDTTQKTLETMCNAGSWPQQCWKSCANGSNIVALRFGNHGKRNFGSCWFKSLTGFNNSQQHATTFNRVCKRTQNIQQCWGCWPTMSRPFVRGLKGRT